MRPRPTLDTAAAAAAAALATAVAGHVGKRPEVFTGDLMYHIAVGRTMSHGSFQGVGPYEGLPSYYGGLYALVLGLAARLGLSPEAVLAVVSWAEPAMWVAVAALVAKAVWPGRRVVRWSFVALLVGAGGFFTQADRIWVNAPNIVGQVWWPLFPRDVAIMASLVGFAAAFRGRWVLAGVLSAVAVGTQAQVGVGGTALACLTLLLSDTDSKTRWRRAVGSGLVAVALSAWWWLPRVFWMARWGLDVRNGEAWVPFHTSAGNLVGAYGLLLIVAAIGAWRCTRRGAERGDRLMGLWLLVSALGLGLSIVLPAEVLAPRRMFVLMTVPLAALGAVGVEWLAHRFSGRWRPAVAVITVAVVMAASVPTFVATRDLGERRYEGTQFRVLTYPPDQWAPLWSSIRSSSRNLLVPSGDASVAWMMTGRPQYSLQRAGFIKAGFDIGRATGWPEDQRRRAVARAYSAGVWAMCDLMHRRSIDAALFRSRPGLLGVIDIEPDRTDRPLPYTWVPRESSTVLGVVGTQPIRAVSVWVANSSLRERVRLAVGSAKSRRPDVIARDGAGLRLDYLAVKRRGKSGEIRIENRSNRSFRVIRTVAYVEAPGVSAPATIRTRGDLCGQDPGGSMTYSGRWPSVWSEMPRGRTLVTPGDADTAWQVTGQPQLFPARADILGVGQQAAIDRRWPALERRTEISRAFTTRSDRSLCELMRSHGLKVALVRSAPGLAGVVDAIPETGRRLSARRVRSQERLALASVGRGVRLDRFDVWLDKRASHRGLSVTVGDSARIRPSRIDTEPGATRLEFSLTGARSAGDVVFHNGSPQARGVLRAVGYVRADGLGDPATYLSVRRICSAGW